MDRTDQRNPGGDALKEPASARHGCSTSSPTSNNNSVDSTSSTASTKTVAERVLEEEATLSPEERKTTQCVYPNPSNPLLGVRRRPQYRAAILKEINETRQTEEEARREEEEIEAMSWEQRVQYVMKKGYKRESAEKQAYNSSAIDLASIGPLHGPGSREAFMAMIHILYDDSD
ncbi:hypothetical protein BJ508DRAFT_308057 [Ascobolus immersus RN42]|uniref:Uncharacterized protein n=1 Tax=Ascobolus immersus RN42 TaxID=1160509 RepID=A0A3N4I2S4_ASCIM|nr:hypothetical protein BJ508DRAFT_308057 [Ascobolus immersus RN42]